jgi:HSP20 family protein
MDPVRTIKLHWVFGGLGDVGYELTRFRFARPVPTWRPPINVYRCEKCIRVCVDLAGVARADIDLQVEPKRIVIRGTREAPDGSDANGRAVNGRAIQMLIMEIDYGPFERTIDLPDAIDVERAHAEQENGLLWISLPAKS